MKKVILFFATLLFGFNVQNIVGEKKYKEYNNLITSIIPKDASIKETITLLKANGLIDLFFNDFRIIYPTFVFMNNNPLFNLKTLNDTLFSLGYAYFYPVKVIKKENILKVTIHLKSNHFIDPVNFINTIENKGCKVVDVRKNKYFTYIIDCENEKLNVKKLDIKWKSYLNVKGSYFFDVENFKKIYISTSKLDFWYPYIVFYDKNLNIISIYAKKHIQRKVLLTIPDGAKYVKIEDNYIKSHFKRGIFIKGIK